MRAATPSFPPRPRARRLLLAGACALASLPAAAEKLTYRFTGTIADVAGALASEFAIGEPVTGSFQVDTQTPDAVAGDPALGFYVGAISALAVHFGDYPLRTDSGYVQVDDQAGFDRFIAARSPLPCCGAVVGAYEPSAFALQLDGNAATLSSDAIPTNLSLGAFSSARSVYIEFSDPGVPGTIRVGAVVESLAVESTPVPVDWEGGPSGEAGGVGVTVSDLEGASVGEADLSGFDFAEAPLAAVPSEVLVYEATSGWTATTSEPVGRLLVHARDWRGAGAGVDPVRYVFDASFQIVAGFAAATVVASGDGDALELPGTGLHSGVLEFCGPIASVSAIATTFSSAEQALTLSVSPLAGAIPVTWTSPGEATAGPIAVAVAGALEPGLDELGYTSAAFAAAPLCSRASSLLYDTGSSWTVSLSAPVESLLVYARAWRGTDAGVDPVTYEFDAPFTILSGLTEATVEQGGTRLVLPATGFHDGILRFAGPLAALHVETNTSSGSQQAVTFAVPEPGSGLAALAAAAALTAIAGRRRPW